MSATIVYIFTLFYYKLYDNIIHLVKSVKIDGKQRMNSNWNSSIDLISQRATIFVHLKILSATKNALIINLNPFACIYKNRIQFPLSKEKL